MQGIIKSTKKLGADIYVAVLMDEFDNVMEYSTFFSRPFALRWLQLKGLSWSQLTFLS